MQEEGEAAAYSEAGEDGEGHDRDEPADLLVRDRLEALQPRPAQRAVLVDSDGGAEDNRQREDDRHHRAERHDQRAVGGADDDEDHAQRDDHREGQQLVHRVLDVVHILRAVHQVVRLDWAPGALCGGECRLDGLRPVDARLRVRVGGELDVEGHRRAVLVDVLQHNTIRGELQHN